MCKYQMWLINQGIHWCKLQRQEYFNHCKDCSCYEEVEMGETCSTSTEEVEIEIKL